MELDSGHRVVPLSEEEQAPLDRLFLGHCDGLIRLEPDGWFFTKPYAKYANAVYNFKFKPSDVLIVTFPKCGTTWLQEVIWTMRNNKNLDHPMAAVPVNVRSPFLEFDFITATSHCPGFRSHPDLIAHFNQACPGKNPDDGIFLQLSDAAPDPRTMKTHLPFSLLPKNLLDVCKVVYAVRNPKDVAVSFHHHSRLFKAHDYKGTFDEFVDVFLNDKVLYSPFWPHVKEALDRKGNKNLHICFYEDLKKNPLEEYQKLNNFLELNLTEDQVKKIMDYTSFSSMRERDNTVHKSKDEDGDKDNPIVNAEVVQKQGGFFRKGEAGDWKGKLNPSQEKRFEEWSTKHSQELNLQMRYGA